MELFDDDPAYRQLKELRDICCDRCGTSLEKHDAPAGTEPEGAR